MNRDFIFQKFLDKHLSIDDINFFNLYLDIVFKQDYDYDNYNEFHHILPKSTFPEYINEDWNLVKLPYEYHIQAHINLFKSFKLRVYQRPINFMDKKFKDFESLSIASKRGWQNLKLDVEKYNKFCENRSICMKNLPSIEQGRRSKLRWDKLNKIECSNEMKKIWKSEEVRKSKSEQMKKYFKENPGEASRRVNKKYDNMSVNEREAFKIKMKEVNNSEEKRKKSGESNKKNWDNFEFREKMSNRKTRKKYIKVISPNGEEFIEYGFWDMIDKYKFNPSLVRSYIDTGIKVPIPKKQADRDININTIGWQFENIKK